MFVLTVKHGKKLMAYVFLGLIFIICFILLLFTDIGRKNSAQTNVAVPDNMSRTMFLQTFGWETESEPCEVKDVIIPEEFNKVYSDYNKIQKAQNFNLEKYKGKRCRHYSYKILNYPNAEKTDEIRANILVFDNYVIGGDVCSTKLGGFMHGFALERA